MNRAGWKADLVSGKKARAKRARRLARGEKVNKALVRIRDERCRFPRCGCSKASTSPMKMIQTVSHDKHKGMGGNPSGEVSTTALMMLLCKWRHQDAPVSRHAGTMQTRYLTDERNDGPVAFLVDLSALYPNEHKKRGTWYEVAREADIGVLDEESLTEEQAAVLRDLAEMVR